MNYLARHVLEIVLICLTAPILAYVYWKLRGRAPARIRHAGLFAAYGWILFGFIMDAERIHRHFPPWLYTAVRSTYLVTVMIAIGAFAVHLVYRILFREPAQHSPQRRRLLQAGYAAPAALLGYGTFIERDQYQVREVDIRIPKLPPELHGLRLAQVTDVHLGPFLSEKKFARVIDMVNTLRPHVAIMTGDLITRRGDPVDECLRQLARIKAEAGLLGCLGNHEIYARAEDYVEEQARRLGMDFLRQRSKPLEFNGRRIHFAGVDYQAKRYGPYLAGAEQLVTPGEVNILLSHNPDVFRVAPEKGFDLTLAGHTHGGQIAVEYLNPHLNAASFVTPWVAGYYHERGASLYVSRGVGTIGVPARIGVPPEITLIRLCAT